MRSAEADQCWRRLYRQKRVHPIITVSGSGIVNIASDPLTFAAPINIISGLNGVGKSTLLKALHVAGDERVIGRNVHGPLGAADGEFTVSVKKGEKEHSALYRIESRTVHRVEGYGLDTDITHIDSAFEVPAIIDLFRKEANLTEALDQVTPFDLNAASLSLVSNIVGKNYQRCLIFELEEMNGFSVIPYVRVEADGAQYGIEDMGLGEAALIYLFWALNRLKDGGVAIIEEPESFVSIRAQSALMDFVAKCAGEKNALVLISTHSPAIFSKVPAKDTVMLQRCNGAISAFVTADPKIRLINLGITPEKRGREVLFIVEDRVSRLVACHWLASFFRDRQEEFSVLDVCDGASQVVSIMEKFPPSSGRVRIIGLLDGDEKSRSHQVERLAYLPSELPPERWLGDSVRRKCELLAEKLNRSQAAVAAVLGAIDGMDHHDWFIELPKRLEVEFDVFVKAAFEIWSEEAESRELSLAAYEQIERLL